MTPEKQCYKCKNTFPRTKEFFARAGKDGFDRICKNCKSTWNKEYYATHERPKTIQHIAGRFLIRYSSRKNNWTVFLKDPWTRLESFDTMEEAKEWTENK